MDITRLYILRWLPITTLATIIVIGTYGWLWYDRKRMPSKLLTALTLYILASAVFLWWRVFGA
jgi:hypothetical protein